MGLPLVRFCEGRNPESQLYRTAFNLDKSGGQDAHPTRPDHLLNIF